MGRIVREDEINGECRELTEEELTNALRCHFPDPAVIIGNMFANECLSVQACSGVYRVIR